MFLVTRVDPGRSGHASPCMRAENKSVGRYIRGGGGPSDLPSQELDTSQGFLSHTAGLGQGWTLLAAGPRKDVENSVASLFAARGT